MQAELQAHIAFHLTGRMSQGEFDALAGSDLHPAIFAGYRDLTALRYDFPLVLIRAGAGPSVQSLSGLFDGAVKAIAADSDGERLRTACRAARARNPQAAGGRCQRLAVEIVGPRRRPRRRQRRRAVAGQPEPPARRAEDSTARSSIATRRCRSACSGTPGRRCRTRRRRNSAPTSTS